MTLPGIPRFDAEPAARELGLVYDGPCPGGQVGAAYVRGPDGRRSVLTTGPDVRELLEPARAAGVPVPRYELVRPPLIVQQLLPGSTPRALSPATIRSMVETNRRCRGILATRHDLPALALYLRGDGPGFCLHQPLRDYDRRTRRLLDQVEEIGAAIPETLDGDDLVHTDFHPENVLVDHPENVLVDSSGAVTGVIDWDGATRGDGRFDLFTLRFDLAHRAPELAALVPDSGEVTPACWAHMSLRLVDWAIRHFTADEVTAWLEVAERLRPT
ncbi:phosphotransferase family protein [Nonomuraea sp. LPB2021202275-12-8]|uniref:phosphotransferase family protein n=1 Tax=Nonomuraea sp. LPB2021202275-12-8 TaxID=3120159 RepID=UPI00300C1ED4